VCLCSAVVWWIYLAFHCVVWRHCSPIQIRWRRTGGDSLQLLGCVLRRSFESSHTPINSDFCCLL
jgi:hypothetical protein